MYIYISLYNNLFTSLYHIFKPYFQANPLKRHPILGIHPYQPSNGDVEDPKQDTYQHIVRKFWTTTNKLAVPMGYLLPAECT